MKKQSLFLKIFFVMCVALILPSGVALAGDNKDMGGWGIKTPYNKLYKAEDVEKFKVVVTQIKEIIPLEGMSPATALVVKESEGEDPILVHVCPAWYKKKGRIGIKKGDKITLRGYIAEINDEEVIMAAKIKNRGKVLKVRLTSDGTPFWTLSPAQLQKELSSE